MVFCVQILPVVTETPVTLSLSSNKNRSGDKNAASIRPTIFTTSTPTNYQLLYSTLLCQKYGTCACEP